MVVFFTPRLLTLVPNGSTKHIFKTIGIFVVSRTVSRSIGLGVAKSPAFGFIVDRVGCYYLADQPSELEQLIEAEPVIDDVLIRCRERFVAHRLCKYMHSFRVPDFSPADGVTRVLVIDQTFGDTALVANGIGADRFSFDAEYGAERLSRR